MSIRPAETSRLRRVLMQSVMWLILAATIGLAALVDAHKTLPTAVMLGEPTKIDNVTLRFPADWEVTSGNRSDTSLQLREPTDESDQRFITARVAPIGFFEAFGMVGKRPIIDSVPISFGNVPSSLKVYRETERDPENGAAYVVLRCETSRPLADGRSLTLQLAHVGRSGQREQNADIELLKSIAATLSIQSK